MLLKARGCFVQPNSRHSLKYHTGAIFAEISRQTLFSNISTDTKLFEAFRNWIIHRLFFPTSQKVWSLLWAQRYWSEIRQKNRFSLLFSFSQRVEGTMSGRVAGKFRGENWKGLGKINLQRRNCWTSPKVAGKREKLFETCSANFHAFLWRWHQPQ